MRGNLKKREVEEKTKETLVYDSKTDAPLELTMTIFIGEHLSNLSKKDKIFLERKLSILSKLLKEVNLK